MRVSDYGTTTTREGQFELKLSYYERRSVSLWFTMDGYRDTVVQAQLTGDSVMDIGTVVLRKMAADTLFDDFNDGNADGWDLDQTALWRVVNRELSVQCPDDKLQHWGMRGFSTSARFPDFRLAVRVKYMAGRRDEAFGIGVIGPDMSKTCLFIARAGYYTVTRHAGSAWREIQPWTATRAIDTIPGRWNRLELEKTGSVLKAIVNDSLLGSFPASDVGELRLVGLYAQGDLRVHFDDVRAVSW